MNLLVNLIWQPKPPARNRRNCWRLPFEWIDLKLMAIFAPFSHFADPFHAAPFANARLFEIQGVRLRLSSNCLALVDYGAEHLYERTIAADALPHVDVQVLWLEQDEYDPQAHCFAGLEQMSKLGKRILEGDNELVWFDLLADQGLQLRMRLEGERLTLHALYHFDPRKKPPEQIPAYRLKRFSSLMKYFVYFPAAWYLEHFRQIYLLHASAVSLDDRAVVIAGVGGVGKTTTCLALLGQKDARMISENLIFYDEQQIYSCYEPVRADDASVALLGKIPPCLRPGRILPRVDDKNIFHLGRAHVVDQATVGALFIPKFTTATTIAPIPLGICVDKLMSINVQAREVDAYYWFAATMGLLWPKAGRAAQRSAKLTRLLSRARLYELKIDPRDGVEAVIDCILKG
jgi:hypothetical protein